MLFAVILSTLAAFAHGYVCGAPHAHDAEPPLPQKILHQFADGTWTENIAVRPNGNLLISTSTPNASVYEVIRPWEDEPEVVLLHTFDAYVDRLIGIGESTKDKFIVVGSKFTSTAETGLPVNGTWSSLEIDYTDDEAKFRLVARMPETYLLQGVWALPWDRETVLISSQFLKTPGQVWRLNTRTGQYSLAITGVKEMDCTNVGAPVGINGIKIRGNQLYWANSDAFTIYRVQIDRTGAIAPGAQVEAVAYYEGAVFDDFIFGPDDSPLIWATGSFDNRVFALNSETGAGVVVLGNGTDSVVPGPTACTFDKRGDTSTLYVTVRDRKLPVNGTFFVGGSLRAIDTSGFWL